MNFSEALSAMQHNARVARAIWLDERLAIWHVADKPLILVNGLRIWEPKQADLFADDWVVVHLAERHKPAQDCVDPEKAKLEARVAELERRLGAVSKALGAAP